MHLLELLERFQTLVAGLIGFAGIILTLIANAALARRQAKETADHKADGIRRAIREELTLIAGTLKRAVELVDLAKADGSTSLLVPKVPITEVYDASIGMLAQLDGKQIGAVVKAYSLIKEFPQRLRLLSGSAGQATGDYIPVGKAHFDGMQAMYRNLLGVANEAIAELR